ncbi:chemokine XC receptor 1-like isoform X1 [Oreochromis aureus]|uniref:G-protein coupled receptors family 1 profile domain-containing protein n=1 Tax=Oreochromis aureus TaxID=47969 RepID=A0AAZ1X4D9_OREAU|nr:chemokine XC receptor 1-like isoform X1 [Oreochromis aureus]
MANNMTTNDGVSDPTHICEDNVPIFTGTFFILIFILSVIGNSLLLCVLFIYEDLKSITNIFILNLACSDLIFTITLPFWAVGHLHHWIFGDFVCKFVTATFFVGLYSSVILLTAMTVARFIRVVLPTWKSNRARRKKCAIGACVAAWVISISASLSDAVKVQVEHWYGKDYCYYKSDENLGRYLQVSLLFFLPFAIIIFCYSAILKTVLQGLNRNKQKTVAVLLCIVAAFFICWGPYHIMLLIKSLDKSKDCKVLKRLAVAYHICEMLAYFHCCMNPLLYMLSQKMRTHLLNLMHCENVRRKNRERDTRQDVAFTAQRSPDSPHSQSLN